MYHNNWKIPYEAAFAPPELLKEGYSPLLAAILCARGIKNSKEALLYLSRDKSLLCDPFLLEDMDKAVSRIERAVAEGESVAVYGDYDVDGISSSCLIAQYLKSRGLSCLVYIPDRIDEGYGINSDALLSIQQSGVSLIITVDCGITAVSEVLYAQSLGMDIIITDHHQCPPILPQALAVINPKRSDSGYPYENLAGVGVAFKLVCALENDPDSVLEQYADLVAVGTVADVMPLTGENRVLVYYGLEKLNRNPRPGFSALLEQAGAGEKTITAGTLGFTLAPRINAAGRLCQTETSVNLLLSENRDDADRFAQQLCQLNHQRQTLEAQVCTSAEEILKDTCPTSPIVLAGEGWHPGIVGIAASRLAEEYRLPAVVICLEGDMGKGSCRSYGDFNLFAAFTACGEHLESFGGHAFAAGINICRDKIDDFREALGQYYQAHPPACQPALEAELKITDLSLLSLDRVDSLSLLEPCGSGNPSPMLCITGAVLESVSSIGKGKHLRLKLSKNGIFMDGVFFSHTPEDISVSPGDIIDVCFVPQINEFRSSRSVQLLVSDLRSGGCREKCQLLLSGTRLPNDELEPFRPSREQLSFAWRSISQRCSKGSLQLCLSETGDFGFSQPLSLCLGLQIFEELGLMNLSYSDNIVSIVIVSDAKKNPLVNSSLFRSLWHMDAPVL